MQVSALNDIKMYYHINNMQSILLFMFFIGIFIIVNSIYQQKYSSLKDNVRVEYRFIPKTYYEEQLSENNVSSTFKTLFDRSDPWFNASVGDPIVALKASKPDNKGIAGVVAGNKLKT